MRMSASAFFARWRVRLGYPLAIAVLWFARPMPRSMLSGALVGLIGLWLRAYAAGYLHKQEVLTVTGPYAYTRNPLYLGSLLMGVGFAVAARSWWVGVALVVMFFAIYVPVIHDEEAFLRQKFPEFEEYARRVPRMFPRILPRSGAEETAGGFSLELYLKHREYNALLGCVLLTGALVIKMMLLS
jgi:protein-S-isoprenylcysteine O-methyltransferase Ste14